MHPQLTAIVQELDGARDRLRGIAASVSDADWTRRPDPDRWSVAECVAHLNLTAEVYLPLIDEALGRAYAMGNGLRRRLRRSPIGWLLWRMMTPPARFKSKTASRFVPTGDLPKSALLARFEELNAAIVERMRTGDGYPIDRVRIASPFDARVKYDLYSAFSILARHEHRHLWQAEQVREALRASGTGAPARREPAAR